MFCREDVAQLKPAPDLFLAALSALQVRPDQALAFEDSPNGVRAAQAAGLRAVGVPNPITSRLGPLPADLTLTSLSDLALPDLLAHFGDTLVLRPEQVEDIPAIRNVEEAAFGRQAEANLVDLSRKRGKSALSLVAVWQGDVLGHVLFTPISLDPPRSNSLSPLSGFGLGPIAVCPADQRTGIGSRLMRAGLEGARGLGGDFVVLLGNPAYYSRFGFKPGRTFGLTSDYGDGDEFQVLELRPSALAGLKGRVKYIPEFKETDC
jgi:putative acetyltransferase